MLSDKLIGKTLVNGFVIEKLRAPAGRNPTGCHPQLFDALANRSIVRAPGEHRDRGSHRQYAARRISRPRCPSEAKTFP